MHLRMLNAIPEQSIIKIFVRVFGRGVVKTVPYGAIAVPVRSGSGACPVFGLHGGANIQETALSGDCPEGHRECHWRTPVSSDPPGREFKGSIPDVLWLPLSSFRDCCWSHLAGSQKDVSRCMYSSGSQSVRLNPMAHISGITLQFMVLEKLQL